MKATTNTPPLLTTRKIIIQIIGWLVGIGLLIWVISGALQQGDWERILHAPPLLVAALLGCTVVSTIVNGATFWITVQPLRRVRMRDMQFLNLMANMLNYAPVRLGAISRVAYHLKVDRLSLLQVGAWFALIGGVLILGIGSCLLAILIRSSIDALWLVLVCGFMVAGGFTMKALIGHPLLAQYAQGIDQIVLDRRALWGAIMLRIIDLGAYVGRMAVALAILEVTLPSSQIVLLGLVALAAGLIPLGRLGFREFCVATVAARLSMESEQVDSVFKQLALVESAGEALVFVPGGAICMLWFRQRWRAATG